MSDVSRKVVPDKGSPNRERPVTKALSFHLAQEGVCSPPPPPSELERRVREGVYTERRDDRYGGWVPSNKRKTKGAVLKIGFLCNVLQWFI